MRSASQTTFFNELHHSTVCLYFGWHFLVTFVLLHGLHLYWFCHTYICDASSDHLIIRTVLYSSDCVRTRPAALSLAWTASWLDLRDSMTSHQFGRQFGIQLWFNCCRDDYLHLRCYWRSFYFETNCARLHSFYACTFIRSFDSLGCSRGLKAEM